MVPEQLNTNVLNGSRREAPSPALQHLLTQSLATLETLLESEAISVPERATVALRILEATRHLSASELPAFSELLPAQTSYSLPQPADASHPRLSHGASQEMEPPQPAISDDWRRWIAENKLLDRSDDSILEAMVRNGIERQVAVRSLAQITSDPCFQAGTYIAELLRKLESVLATNQKVAELSPSFGTIDRRSRLSREEFFETYYSQNKPVILTEMMSNWSALSRWSPEFIKSHYGDVAVEIQANRNADPAFEVNKAHHKKIVKLSEYADMVVNGGATNDYYLTANNSALDRQELKRLLDDIEIIPEFLDGSDIHNKVFFWFGPSGTLTPLHHDANHLMMAQVSGRKRWKIISPNQTPLLYNYFSVFSKVDCDNPDYDRYPLFKDVRILEAVLEPGEIIYLPVGWWHQVKSLDISFSVSFTNFVFPNLYDYKNPTITHW